MNIQSITDFLNNLSIEWIISGLIILILLLSGSIGLKDFIVKKRRYYASCFGKTEHFFGRLLGLELLVAIGLEYINFKYNIYFLIIIFISWGIYLISHTFEKLIYGNYGPRG